MKIVTCLLILCLCNVFESKIGELNFYNFYYARPLSVDQQVDIFNSNFDSDCLSYALSNSVPAHGKCVDVFSDFKIQGGWSNLVKTYLCDNIVYCNNVFESQAYIEKSFWVLENRIKLLEKTITKLTDDFVPIDDVKERQMQ